MGNWLASTTSLGARPCAPCSALTDPSRRTTAFNREALSFTHPQLSSCQYRRSSPTVRALRAQLSAARAEPFIQQLARRAACHKPASMTRHPTYLLAYRQQPQPLRRHHPRSMVVLLALLSVTFTTMAQTHDDPPASAFPASPDCRCLTTQEVRDRAANILRPDPSNPANGVCLASDIASCLPANYGSGSCRQWDLISDPECQTDGDLPSRCNMGWCFVDETTCQRHFRRAVYVNSSQPLYYSYPACGYMDLDIEAAAARLTSTWPSELRVSYPTLDDHRLFVAPERSMYRDVSFGVYPDLLQRAVLFLNYTGTTRAVQLTPQSWDFAERYFSNSSWDACVYMLAVNDTDVCSGPFRNSDERALMAGFMHPIQFEEFYLVVPVQDISSRSILQSFLNPFRPFTGGAWLGWFLVLCWVVLVFQWLEVSPRWAASVATTSSKAPQGFDSGLASSSTTQNEGWPRATTNWLARMVMRLQLSAEALDILGERLFLPMTVGGKLVSVTLSLFLMTMVASYTANLAAVLSSHTLVGDLSSVHDVIAARLPTCVPRHGSAAIRSAYPDMVIVEGLESTLIPSILAGTCSCAVMTRTVAEDFQMVHGCQVRIVGGALHTLPVSMMARKELLLGLNLAAEYALSHGIPTLLSKHWKGFYYAARALEVSDPSVCQDPDAIHDYVAASLDILDIGGVYGLVFLSTLVALAVEMVCRLWRQPIHAEGKARCARDGHFHVLNADSHKLELEPEDTVHVQVPPGCASCTLSLSSIKHDCMTISQVADIKVGDDKAVPEDIKIDDGEDVIEDIKVDDGEDVIKDVKVHDGEDVIEESQELRQLSKPSM